MTYGSLASGSSGGMEHKTLMVTLANRSECVSSVDVYFLPDGDATKLDPKNKMSTKDDGAYTLDLPSYTWTGKERVVAALRGFDATVTTDPYAVTAPTAPNVIEASGNVEALARMLRRFSSGAHEDGGLAAAWLDQLLCTMYGSSSNFVNAPGFCAHMSPTSPPPRNVCQ